MDQVINFFSVYKQVFIILHVFAVVVGMGAALVSDVLFNSYIKDKMIQGYENKTLTVLSKVVWVGLLLIVLSGLFIFLSDPLEYMYSVKFLVKMTIVGFVVINGAIFWYFIHPQIQKINFVSTDLHNKYVRLRKISFALGAVSVISWTLVFLLGTMQSISLSYLSAMSLYLLISLVGVLASQIIEYKITHS